MGPRPSWMPSNLRNASLTEATLGSVMVIKRPTRKDGATLAAKPRKNRKTRKPFARRDGL
jgi:hypothetical protein